MKSLFSLSIIFFELKNPPTKNGNVIYSPDCSGNPFCFWKKTKRLERKAGPEVQNMKNRLAPENFLIFGEK